MSFGSIWRRLLGRGEPVLSAAGIRDAAALSALHAASFHRGWSDGEFEALLIDRNVVAHRAMIGASLVGFILSRVIANRFEPLLNVGVDINANNVDRSAFRWAVGGTAQVVGPLTAAVVFLGRNDFNPQSDQIEEPFFFQIERNNIYDASVGLRLLFAESGVVSVNTIFPLNDDGLRANVIPTLEVQYAFSAPW